MIDMTPATERLAELVRGVADDDLRRPTPCAAMTVGDLLDHVDGLAGAFTAAARKEPVPVPDPPDGARLGAEWRTRIPERLAALAEAWRSDDAWRGPTEVGGLGVTGDVAGAVAVNEVIVHGWDVAMATGRYFAADDGLLDVALSFVRGSAEQNPHGSPGLFGPPVPVPDGAPALHRLLGLAGRDPGPVPEIMSREGRGTHATTDAGTSMPMPWGVAMRAFADGGWFWLATVRPDGAPHVMPVFAAWASPVFYVATKRTTRKSRNLAADGRCVLSRDTGPLHIVVEGDAERVTGADGLAAASAAFDAVYGWPTTVAGDELDAPFGAPTSGGPPFRAYAIRPRTAFAFPTDGESATPTRWRFGE